MQIPVKSTRRTLSSELSREIQGNAETPSFSRPPILTFPSPPTGIRESLIFRLALAQVTVRGVNPICCTTKMV
jgi:hypothetical protein